MRTKYGNRALLEGASLERAKLDKTSLTKTRLGVAIGAGPKAKFTPLHGIGAVLAGLIGLGTVLAGAWLGSLVVALSASGLLLASLRISTDSENDHHAARTAAGAGDAEHQLGFHLNRQDVLLGIHLKAAFQLHWAQHTGAGEEIADLGPLQHR